MTIDSVSIALTKLAKTHHIRFSNRWLNRLKGSSNIIFSVDSWSVPPAGKKEMAEIELKYISERRFDHSVDPRGGINRVNQLQAVVRKHQLTKRVKNMLRELVSLNQLLGLTKIGYVKGHFPSSGAKREVVYFNPSELAEKELQKLAAAPEIKLVVDHSTKPTQCFRQQYGAPTSHPWQKFLDARVEVIRWMHKEGQTNAYIAEALSMDPVQVMLILAHQEK